MMFYTKIRNYKYRLSADYVIETALRHMPFEAEFIQLTEEGIFTVRKGYLWDGVSGPTWDSGNTMIAGLIHDALYQAIRQRLLPRHMKNTVDYLFYMELIAGGMNKFRANYYHVAVKTFGHLSCKPGDIKAPKVRFVKG